MFSLEDLLGGNQGSVATEQIGQNLGADPSVVNSAIKIALPAILGGLAGNASSDAGAQRLDQALERDHDGGLLDSLSDYLAGGVPAPENASRQTDGSGILGHILGSGQGQIAKEISENTGLDMGQAANLLITLAPIVMAYLGKQKQEKSLDQGGLSDLLTGSNSPLAPSGGSLLDIASSMLDRDRDGSAVDDLASLARDYFMK